MPSQSKSLRARDRQGNLYGTTMGGGTSYCVGEGCGMCSSSTPQGHEMILHRFTNGADGGHPTGSLLRDSDGNLYGTADSGATNDAGTIFKIDEAGNETVLYDFIGGSDGSSPSGGVVRDAAGNMFGTTEFGGGGALCRNGCGTVLELDSSGRETVLYRFTGKKDGADPAAGVIVNADGFLYGTAPDGGNQKCANAVGCGVAFKLKP